MKKHILLPEDVAPAKIIFDDLILDPDLPLESQAEWELKEDLFMAEFPNGCALAVGWYPSFDPSGSFGINLNQTEFYWDPFIRRDCRSIDELKKIIEELVGIGRSRPSIPQVLLNEDMARPAYGLSEDVILDPMAPLESQLDKLREKMCRAFRGKYRIQVGWLPPHSPTGEFVLTLSRASERHSDEGPFELWLKNAAGRSRRCLNGLRVSRFRGSNWKRATCRRRKFEFFSKVPISLNAIQITYIRTSMLQMLHPVTSSSAIRRKS